MNSYFEKLNIFNASLRIFAIYLIFIGLFESLGFILRIFINNESMDTIFFLTDGSDLFSGISRLLFGLVMLLYIADIVTRTTYSYGVRHGFHNSNNVVQFTYLILTFLISILLVDSLIELISSIILVIFSDSTDIIGSLSYLFFYIIILCGISINIRFIVKLIVNNKFMIKE